MEERLDRMEDLLIRMNQTRVQTAPVPSEQRMPTATTGSANDRLIEEISKLQQKLGDQENTIAQLKESDANRSRDSSQKKIEIHAPSSDALTAEPVSSSSGFNFNKGMALFVGPSFGDATNFNIGVRSYHAFSNTTIMFSPDISVGFGSKMSFGVNANGLIPISLNSNYTPYLGAGVGLNYIDSSIKIAPNFIGGVSTKIEDVASVYLEYTARGAFKNNQIALGYRFRF